MIEQLKSCLSQGKYNEARELLKEIDDLSIRDIIMSIAYETENIFVYSFIHYMINMTHKKSWIELSIDVMINPLCFLEGAYSIALFHSRELFNCEKSIANQERLLFFYNIPEKLISDDEARDIANEILKIDPQNVIALNVLNFEYVASCLN